MVQDPLKPSPGTVEAWRRFYVRRLVTAPVRAVGRQLRRNGPDPRPSPADADHWLGAAVVHPIRTSGQYRDLVARWRRRPVPGILAVAPDKLSWFPDGGGDVGTGVVISGPTVVRIEFTRLGLRAAGVVITNQDDEQLWLQVARRRGLAPALSELAG